MNPDLHHLIKLQAIESETEAAGRAIEVMPAKRQAIEARVAEEAGAVAAARQHLVDNQSARRAIEKELAVVQARLTKFKDQLMEVKTNREYQAMQLEIATAQTEIKRFEDRLLELMIEADDLAATVKKADTELGTHRAQADTQLRTLDVEAVRLKQVLEEASARRAAVASALNPEALSMFEFIRARRGTAVVEARDGHCTVCHVRLRPQVFNEVRLNQAIIKCDSCGRILYFVPPAEPAAPQAPQASQTG